MKNTTITPFYVINWDINRDTVEHYDVMPYLVDCWKEEKKRKYKIWNLTHTDDDKKIDDTKMPETLDEFKKFVNSWAQYNFWARCEYECIVSGWPIQKHEHKMDVYEQIKMNLDVIAKIFMDNVNE